ncbi:hypothetical protein, partial [Shimia sp.]|uniref:hypothetical protein n=1 Tax=Shimia sp. TaxID=1954381 RepID=UPI003567CFAB
MTNYAFADGLSSGIHPDEIPAALKRTAKGYETAYQFHRTDGSFSSYFTVVFDGRKGRGYHYSGKSKSRVSTEYLERVKLAAANGLITYELLPGDWVAITGHYHTDAKG